MDYNFIKDIYLASPAWFSINLFLLVLLVAVIVYCYKNRYSVHNGDAVDKLKYIISTVSTIDIYDKH